MIKTKDVIEAFGDMWMDLFPHGRTCFLIVNAIDWSKEKGRIVPTVVSAKIDKIGLEGDQVWMWLKTEQYGAQDARVDDDSFLEKVFLFEDEAQGYLKKLTT